MSIVLRSILSVVPVVLVLIRVNPIMQRSLERRSQIWELESYGVDRVGAESVADPVPSVKHSQQPAADGEVTKCSKQRTAHGRRQAGGCGVCLVPGKAIVASSSCAWAVKLLLNQLGQLVAYVSRLRINCAMHANDDYSSVVGWPHNSTSTAYDSHRQQCTVHCPTTVNSYSSNVTLYTRTGTCIHKMYYVYVYQCMYFCVASKLTTNHK